MRRARRFPCPPEREDERRDDDHERRKRFFQKIKEWEIDPAAGADDVSHEIMVFPPSARWSTMRIPSMYCANGRKTGFPAIQMFRSARQRVAWHIWPPGVGPVEKEMKIVVVSETCFAMDNVL